MHVLLRSRLPWEALVTTYTWNTGGISGANFGIGGQNGHTDLAIPANATVKRFMLRQIYIQGYQSGTTFTTVVPLSMFQQVSFTTGKYAGRNIYSSRKSLPMTATVFLATAIPAYNVWYNAGDKEMGFNERCAYGGAGAPASNIRFSWRSDQPGGYTTTGAVGLDYIFAVLYSV